MSDGERVWVTNVETGQMRTIPAAELATLQSPWVRITAGEAVRAHLKSVR